MLFNPRIELGNQDKVAQGYDQTLMLRGFAFAKFGMVEESLKYFEAVLKIDPKNRASKFYLERFSPTD